MRGGRLEWTFRVGPTRTTVLFWAFHAQLYVASEDRVKANEVVLSRPDISTVVAFHRGPTLRECRILLIREFRAPASTADGFVRELPGGSGLRGDPLEQAAAGFARNPAWRSRHTDSRYIPRGSRWRPSRHTSSTSSPSN